MAGCEATLDFAFLDSQTFGDDALAREVLTLFQDQAGRLLPQLGTQGHDQQTDASHLLKGSCQGIGASHASTLLQRYEAATPAERQRLLPELTRAFEDLRGVIGAYLAAR